MFDALYVILEQIEFDKGEEIISDKFRFFMDRTKNHIDLVKKASKKIEQSLPEFKGLYEIAIYHDASKYNEPEIFPYIELTWNKKNGVKAQGDMEQRITDATLHHIKNNKHHPEYWLKDKKKANLDSTNRDNSIECIDAFNMPDMAIAEMVADWQAMSEELQTNTAREWFDNVRNKRWRFSNKQEKLIDKLLGVFENGKD